MGSRYFKLLKPYIKNPETGQYISELVVGKIYHQDHIVFNTFSVISLFENCIRFLKYDLWKEVSENEFLNQK